MQNIFSKYSAAWRTRNAGQLFVHDVILQWLRLHENRCWYEVPPTIIPWESLIFFCLLIFVSYDPCGRQISRDNFLSPIWGDILHQGYVLAIIVSHFFSVSVLFFFKQVYWAALIDARCTSLPYIYLIIALASILISPTSALRTPAAPSPAQAPFDGHGVLTES